MKRILVTGAAGFIGFQVANALSKDADTQVFVVDNHIRGEKDAAYQALCARPSVSAFDIDLTDAHALSALPDACDVIFHMAALNGTQNFYERPYDVVRCCTLPTFHLLDRYGPTKLKRFVYAGSSEAYAGTVEKFNWPVPTNEDVPLCIADPTNPRWSYGASKLHGEVLVINACRQYSADYTIIRYHNVYGPRMGDKHVVPDFLKRMRQGVYALYGHEETRAFMYVADAVRATLLLAESAAAANEIVNVGSEREVQIYALGKEILKISSIDADIELYDSPKGSVRRRAPGTKKLRSLIDFREEWTLTEGLRETMKFYLRENYGQEVCQ
jgi:nucleoside-diphosphate-sugar epimerase